MKELIAAIPTRRDALYESAVDWEAAEAAGVLESKIRPWLAKKIAEYLGEEELTLVEFVMTKLAERLPPAKIEAEMVQVLDDDAEMFVVKLWRLHTLRGVEGKGAETLDYLGMDRWRIGARAVEGRAQSDRRARAQFRAPRCVRASNALVQIPSRGGVTAARASYPGARAPRRCRRWPAAGSS